MSGDMQAQGVVAPQNRYSPMTNYSPAEYDMALVALSRAQALEDITVAAATSNGTLLAWESTKSFAESLIPMAGAAFLRSYVVLSRFASVKGIYPCRALWRIASLEAKRQKRLGADQVPMARVKFGVEPE